MRSRLRTIKLPRDQWDHYVLAPGEEKPSDQLLSFIEEKQFVIECCCGKGEFLVEEAVKYPGKHFVGIDYAFPVVQRAVKRAAEHGLDNIRFLHATMERSLALIPRSPRLERIYINFSDPWPKKRHWKRRVIQQETLRLVHRVMEEETVLYVVTDHPGYKEWIREQLDRASDLFQPVEEDWAVDAMDEFHESDYMMKGLARGYTISFFLARRVIPAGQKD